MIQLINPFLISYLVRMEIIICVSTLDAAIRIDIAEPQNLREFCYAWPFLRARLDLFMREP